MTTIPSFTMDPRALKMMQQRERFRWFARSLEDRLETFSFEEMLGLLEDPSPRWPAQREKALVLLALEGSAEAGEAIALFDPGCSEETQIFHAVCADEWARSLTLAA